MWPEGEAGTCSRPLGHVCRGHTPCRQWLAVSASLAYGASGPQSRPGQLLGLRSGLCSLWHLL